MKGFVLEFFAEYEFASRGGTTEAGKYGAKSTLVKISRSVIKNNIPLENFKEYTMLMFYVECYKTYYATSLQLEIKEKKSEKKGSS